MYKKPTFLFSIKKLWLERPNFFIFNKKALAPRENEKTFGFSIKKALVAKIKKGLFKLKKRGVRKNNEKEPALYFWHKAKSKE
jgi:hypothetical protein